jgi:hypothetical protein
MPQTCTVCKHPQRAAIETTLVQGHSYRYIALHFQVGAMAVYRHRENCMPEEIAKSQEAREAAFALNVAEQLHAINVQSLALLKEARAALNRIQTSHADAVPSVDELLAMPKERRALTLKLSGIHSWRRNQDMMNAMQAIDRVHKQLELQAKLQGDLAQEGTVNIWMSPEWASARTSLLDALRPFPEARVAVAQALLAIEEASHGSARPA